MPSHFSSLGFAIESREGFSELARRLASSAEPFPVDGGEYLRWASGGGIEIWLQLDAHRNLIGMNPHFAGISRVRAGIVKRLVRPDDTPLDGAFEAWADPPGDAPTDGSYPFVFDCPDARLSEGLSLPMIASVQLAAFAHEISAFDTPEAYAASQSNGGPGMASKSFIPIGVFRPSGRPQRPPASMAMFTGHVLEASERTNPLTGIRFHLARVETYSAVIDVVADRTLLQSLPEAGSVLSGVFWLSGRLQPPS